MSKKSIYLYVSGDGGDYGAMYFEEKYDAQKVYEEMVAEGITEKAIPHPEYEDEGIEVEIKVFESVDPEFESFIFDEFIEYDQTKARNIYNVEMIKR